MDEKMVPKYIRREPIPFVAKWTEADLKRLNFKSRPKAKTTEANNSKQSPPDKSSGEGQMPPVQVMKRKAIVILDQGKRCGSDEAVKDSGGAAIRQGAGPA